MLPFVSELWTLKQTKWSSVRTPSYRKPSRYKWTRIWPRTANTSRWRRTSQRAGRRTSPPDRTRQVSVRCQKRTSSKYESVWKRKTGLKGRHRKLIFFFFFLRGGSRKCASLTYRWNWSGSFWAKLTSFKLKLTDTTVKKSNRSKPLIKCNIKYRLSLWNMD